jgi:hypothetical protein
VDLTKYEGHIFLIVRHGSLVQHEEIITGLRQKNVGAEQELVNCSLTEASDRKTWNIAGLDFRFVLIDFDYVSGSVRESHRLHMNECRQRPRHKKTFELRPSRRHLIELSHMWQSLHANSYCVFWNGHIKCYGETRTVALHRYHQFIQKAGYCEMIQPHPKKPLYLCYRDSRDFPLIIVPGCETDKEERDQYRPLCFQNKEGDYNTGHRVKKIRLD